MQRKVMGQIWASQVGQPEYENQLRYNFTRMLPLPQVARWRGVATYYEAF
jgi:hypothetical protein